MGLNLWNEWFGAKARRIGQSRRIQAAQLRLEVLEDRTMPSVSPLGFPPVLDATTIELVSSDNTPVAGENLTFTATVHPHPTDAGMPSGKAVFILDGKIQQAAPLDGNGAAQFTILAKAGPHTITAAYSGDAVFASSDTTADPFQFKVSKATPEITWSTPANIPYGTPLTASQLDAEANVAGKFIYGPGRGTILRAGDHTLNVKFVPLDSRDYRIATDHVTIHVDQAASSVVLRSSSPVSVSGQGVTFAALVTPEGVRGKATGLVDFYDGGVFLGHARLKPVGGSHTFRAAISTRSLSVDTHEISAIYVGDSNVLGSSSTDFVQRVDQASSSVIVRSNEISPVQGQTITLKARVRADAPGSGIPQGTVTFKDGSTVLWSGQLNAKGIVSFKTAALDYGVHMITVSYGGNGNFLSSKNVLTENVRTNTATRFILPHRPPVFGEEVTLKARVTYLLGNGTPKGKVDFMEHGVVLGSGFLNANGIAEFTTSDLAVGKHNIIAVYEGDNAFHSSVSATKPVNVHKAASAVIPPVTITQAAYGDSITWKVQVVAVAPGNGMPTGVVRFGADGKFLGEAVIDSEGYATFTTQTPLLRGNHRITAFYHGDSHFTASHPSAVWSQFVV